MIKTIFCDIDGTLLKFSEDTTFMDDTVPLKGVVDCTLQWHIKGYKIILVTGRPEPYRQRTEEQLQEVGILYDQLVMGVGTGPRYLINDVTPEGKQTSFGISVAKNEGFNSNILEAFDEECKKEKSKIVQGSPEIDDLWSMDNCSYYTPPDTPDINKIV